jgi:hypothetical protein
MGLFDELNVQENSFIPYLNTGTLVDIAVGGFVPGVNNTMILNGGIGMTNGVVGREQRFKSTTTISLMMGVLGRYINSDLLVNDTEFSIGTKERLLGMADMPVDTDRIRLTDPSNYDMAGLFTEIRRIVKHKIENKKDYLVETPFINPKTLKPIMMYIPTLVMIDSWSKLYLQTVDDLYDKASLGDSQLNMVYMKDGNAKTQFMQHLPTLAAKAGIYFILTAHVGDKFEMDAFSKSPKDLQHMNQRDTIKNVGSQFNYLTSLLLENRTVTVLQDSKKECQYPIVGCSPMELSSVKSVVNRCKNNISGTTMTHIVSQNNGIIRGLSNYELLLDNDSFGMTGNNIKKHVGIYSEPTLMRTTVRQQLRDSYELCRALEILAQLCYIQNYWSNTGTEEVSFRVLPEKFTEMVLAKKDVIAEILNSRGYWTYDKKDPRKYMSLYDILVLLNK